MAQIRAFVSSDSISSTAVNPLWKGEFSWEREREQIFYRLKMRSEMVFTGADFTLLAGAPDCESITVTVERRCGGTWSLFFTGKFTKFDCKFDLDRCQIRTTPKAEDGYKCLLANWSDDENIYNASVVTQARGLGGTYQAAIYTCFECRPTPDLSPCATHTDACIEPGFPRVVSYPSPDCPEPNRYKVATSWHREIGVGTPTVPPPYGSGWTHLTGNDWWRCPDQAQEMQIGVLKYGRLFNSVLTYLVGLTGCGLTVRSHFFGINATHSPAAPSNIAYAYAEAKLRHMTVHQKSDVKRPDSSDPSFQQVWNMKLKDLLDDLRTMFNVRWKIIGTDLILEHISYFQAITGADYSGQNYPQQYEQDDDGAPQRELWKWSDDAVTSLAHGGKPIEYGCGDGDLDNKVKLFTCEITTVRQSANAENIADKGWVLAANFLQGGQHIVFSRQ